MPNRALVMSGGGSKGAFQVGAVDYLVNDRGLDFQVLAGVSTGSLNAAVLAQGTGRAGLQQQIEALKTLWFGIRSREDILLSRFLGRIFVLLFKQSMFSPEPLMAKLRAGVSLDRLQRSGKQLRVGAVSLESGQYRSVAQTDSQLLEWVLASASIPVAFPPVNVGGQSAVDGGVRNVTPLEDAFRALKAISPEPGMEPDEIYVVLASPLETEAMVGPWKNGLQIGTRSVSILVNEVFREDISYALAVNEGVRFYTRLHAALRRWLGGPRTTEVLESLEDTHPFRFKPPRYRYVTIRAIVPDLTFSESLDFNPTAIRAAYLAGREAARDPLDEERLARLLGADVPAEREPAREVARAS